MYLRAPHGAERTVSVPGDKSISHRALFLASMARGRTRIVGANGGDDVLATARALASFGVSVERSGGDFIVSGRDDLIDPSDVVDCGNSGTSMRLLCGFAAGRANATLDGDASLRTRPMERVAIPLRVMGAHIETGIHGFPPVVLHRSAPGLRGATVEQSVPSAQVKTAVLLAGLRATGQTVYVERVATRDHTERMLIAMGADFSIAAGRLAVRPCSPHALERIEVPGDFSSAFFYLAGAVVSRGGRVTIAGVGVNPTRTAGLDVLRAMGADVTLHGERSVHEEPLADIEARGGKALHGIDIPPSAVPNLIDEIPALCAVAAASQGTLVVTGAAELREKESDRLATTVALVRAFGGDADARADGIVVRGGRALRAPDAVDTHGDHRIGMSAAILAVASGAPLRIDDADCIATSFPDFEQNWNSTFAA